MALNTLGLVAGIAVARREGVAPDQVARVALPGAIFPNLAVGVILVDRLAKQEASAEAATAGVVSTGGGSTSGGGGSGGGGDPSLLPEPVQYPSVGLVPVAKTFQLGDKLKVDPGQWLRIPQGVTPEFQWFRDGEDIDTKQARTDEYTV